MHIVNGIYNRKICQKPNGVFIMPTTSQVSKSIRRIGESDGALVARQVNGFERINHN